MGFVTVGHPHIIFKIMEREWIDLMYEKGSIRMNIPRKWIKEEEDGHKGRGDKYEGVFAIDKNGEDREEQFKKKYKNQLIVNVDEENDSKYYQLQKTVDCPTFCFYSLTDEHFEVPQNIDKEGVYPIIARIAGEYFKNFSDGKTKEEVEKLPESEQPAMLIIFGGDNIKLFVQKIKQALKEQYGVTDSEFLIDQVQYNYSRTDKVSYTSARNHSPQELFSKGSEYKDQREGRIVVNTKRHKGKYLDIKIGSMAGYASVCYGYMPEELTLKINAEWAEKGSILKRDGEINYGYTGILKNK